MPLSLPENFRYFLATFRYKKHPPPLIRFVLILLVSLRKHGTEAAANDKGLLTKKTLMPDGIRCYYAAPEVTTNIINLNSTAFYQNYVAGGGLSFSVTYDDTTVSGDDYTSMIKDKVGNTVANYAQIGTGTYSVEITGESEDYAGTLSTNFTVYANKGTGTEGDPYQIESTGDWNKFADIDSARRCLCNREKEIITLLSVFSEDL